MTKHSKVTDPAGLIITDRINNNFGFLSVDPPELTVTSNTIDLSEASVTSNIYSIDSASSEVIDTIVGGVVGQQITIVNNSTTNTITFNGTGGNIKGLTGSAILSDQYSNIVLGKIDTTNWGVVSSSGNIILENIFGISYGNAKDGNAAATNFSAVTGGRLMGGEYWFNEFEIDDDIVVDASIGWLVIRANVVTVTKSGGALIDGTGKSCSISSIYNKYTQGSHLAFPGQGGTGACNAYAAGYMATSTASSDSTDSVNNLVGKYLQGTAGLSITTVGTQNTVGNSGLDGHDASPSEFLYFLNNPSYGAMSGVPGTNGMSRYNNSELGITTSYAAAGAGGKSGANVLILAKSLSLEEDLAIEVNGLDGTTSSTATRYPSGTISGGAGGGGASGNIGVCYVSLTGAGVLTTEALGGQGATAASASTVGGAGGDGGDGLVGLIDDFAKTIDINGSGMLPA